MWLALISLDVDSAFALDSTLPASYSRLPTTPLAAIASHSAIVLLWLLMLRSDSTDSLKTVCAERGLTMEAKGSYSLDLAGSRAMTAVG